MIHAADVLHFLTIYLWSEERIWGGGEGGGCLGGVIRIYGVNLQSCKGN